MEHLNAPFEASACDRLNQFQVGVNEGFLGHPFTCANRNDGKHGNEGGDLGILIAVEEGWVCPHCDYTQQWAHPVMASESQSGLPDWLAESRKQQLPAHLSKVIADYQLLTAKKPEAKGVSHMLMSLNKRASDLNL